MKIDLRKYEISMLLAALAALLITQSLFDRIKMRIGKHKTACYVDYFLQLSAKGHSVS